LDVRVARVKWRDIHAITGVLFGLIFLFFLMTGLAWTGVWGATYKEVATRAGAHYPEAFAQGVPSRTIGDDLGEGRSGWAASELPSLPSGHPSAHASSTLGALSWNTREGAPLDAIITQAQMQGIPPGFSVSLPTPDRDSYYVFYGFQKGQSVFDQRALYIDRYTAEPLAEFRLSDFGPMAQATDVGIAFHEGDELGLLGQLLSLTGALAVLLSLSTAVAMWYHRRPRGLGAPSRVRARSALAGLTLITLTLGVVFPLLGLSLLALLAFDLLVVRNVSPVARALGAA
jgi:uncharacterized iron-regulated membrane protein